MNACLAVLLYALASSAHAAVDQPWRVPEDAPALDAVTIVVVVVVFVAAFAGLAWVLDAVMNRHSQKRPPKR